MIFSAFSILKKIMMLLVSFQFWILAFLFCTGPGQILVFVMGWLAVFLTMLGLDLPLMNYDAESIVRDFQFWSSTLTLSSFTYLDEFIFDGFTISVFITAIILNVRWLVIPSPFALPFEELLVNLVYISIALIWLPFFLYFFHVPIKMMVTVIISQDMLSAIVAAWFFFIGIPILLKLPIFGADEDNLIIFGGFICFVFLLKLPSRSLLKFPRSNL